MICLLQGEPVTQEWSGQPTRQICDMREDAGECEMDREGLRFKVFLFGTVVFPWKSLQSEIGLWS